MKYLFLTGCMLLVLCVSAQTKNPAYDPSLAKKLGADDYGMKRYIMAFLKEGPNRSVDSIKSAELQKAHLKNIEKPKLI